MIIWKKWGILAIVVPSSLLLVSNIGLDLIYGDNFYKLHKTSIVSIVLAITSPIIYYLGRRLNDKTKKSLQSVNTFYWIPLEHWGFIFYITSIYLYFHKLS